MALLKSRSLDQADLTLFRPIVNSVLLLAAFAVCASASSFNGSITGTCGFYQGDRSSVVYSETFTGDGTFCTGFMTGGSFSQTSTLQVGDIFATASHNTLAKAPAGYGAFASFDTTFQVTQEYLISAPVPSSTATGTVTTFQQISGSTDDGSGLGSCQTIARVSLAGHSETETPFSFPVTFGQPVAAVETVHILCNEYAPSWGDGGFQMANDAPILVYDANGNLLGPAVIATVPEPDFIVLGFLASSAFAFTSAAMHRRSRILRMR